jgi:hypothetical protein
MVRRVIVVRYKRTRVKQSVSRNREGKNRVRIITLPEENC